VTNPEWELFLWMVGASIVYGRPMQRL
jgi:hypothetical protein